MLGVWPRGRVHGCETTVRLRTVFQVRLSDEVDEGGAVAQQLRLMSVHAHPDDESSKGAATLAKYVAEGVEVRVVTCTGGERGDVLNDAVDLGGRELATVRREEMARAVSILGISHRWLGFPDSGFPEPGTDAELPEGSFAALPLEVVVEPLVAAIREFRPHVLVTYDEEGGYPHPDHIRTHEVSAEAFEAAADPDRFPAAGPAWAPLKLYYDVTFHKDRMRVLHEAAVTAGGDSPFGEWLANWGDRPEKTDRVTTRVECCDFFHVREEALKAHATQVDPTGRWFAIPLAVHSEAWPTEDFELAAARMEPRIPEAELFDGITADTPAGQLRWRTKRRT